MGKEGIKVLITFLGTGIYSECEYYKEGEEKKSAVKAHYVQEAIIRKYGPYDYVLVFMTEDACKENYEGRAIKKDNKKEILKGKGLKSTLEKLKREGLIEKYGDAEIPIGKNEEERWEIFKKIEDKIKMLLGNENKLEIHFDITHSFRSIPLMALVFLDYIKSVFKKEKEIKTKILYGAYETKEDNKAPIFDLSIYNLILRWISAVEMFINTGNAKMLYRLAEELMPKEKGNTKLREFLRLLGSLTTDILTCRYKNVEDKVFGNKNIFSLFEEAKKDLEETKVPPLIPLMNIIKKKLDSLVEIGGKNVGKTLFFITLSKWCLDHGHVQQAATYLREGIVTYLMRKMKIPKEKIYKEKERGYIENLLNEFKDEQKQEVIKNILKIWDGIREIRNDINHAGFRSDRNHSKRRDSETINSELEKCLKELTESLLS